MTINVLFICAGNICRSPMAEAVFRHLVSKQGIAEQFEIDSAGTGGWHVGDPPHLGTQDVLHRNQIGFEGQQSRQVTAADLHHYDYLVVMDSQNWSDIESLVRYSGGSKGELVRLLDFADASITHGRKDVPDPYYDGGYETVYDLVRSGCEGLLAHIRAKT